MAINLYLAENYGKWLWPTGEADQAQTMQWSFWALTELEPPLVKMMGQVIYKQPHEADVGRIEESKQELERPLNVLDMLLKNRETLLGNNFSIADLNVASVLGISGLMRFSLQEYGNVNSWLTRCWNRAANLRVDPQL